MDNEWSESTLNLMVTLHGTTQTRCIVMDKANSKWQCPQNPQQHFLSFLSFLHDCLAPKLPTIHSQIHPTHSGRKQDLPPTNQNTRSRTRRYSTSCKLVPSHDSVRDNHSRRLKLPINAIFAISDSFYHPHFAFPFGLPAVPYCRGGPNVQRWISPSKHPPNPSIRVNPSFHVITTAAPQGQYRI